MLNKQLLADSIKNKRVITLKNLGIRTEDLELIAKELANNPEITILDLTNNNITTLPKKFIAAVVRHKNLIKINLKNNSLTTTKVRTETIYEDVLIGYGGMDKPYYEKISREVVRESSTEEELKEEEIDQLNDALSEKKTRLIHKALENNQLVDLSGLDITAKDLTNFSPSLKKNQIITSLNLSNNKITELPKDFISALLNHPSLVDVDLNNNKDSSLLLAYKLSESDNNLVQKQLSNKKQIIKQAISFNKKCIEFISKVRDSIKEDREEIKKKFSVLRKEHSIIKEAILDNNFFNYGSLYQKSYREAKSLNNQFNAISEQFYTNKLSAIKITSHSSLALAWLAACTQSTYGHQLEEIILEEYPPNFDYSSLAQPLAVLCKDIKTITIKQMLTIDLAKVITKSIKINGENNQIKKINLVSSKPNSKALVLLLEELREHPEISISTPDFDLSNERLTIKKDLEESVITELSAHLKAHKGSFLINIEGSQNAGKVLNMLTAEIKDELQLSIAVYRSDYGDDIKISEALAGKITKLKIKESIIRESSNRNFNELLSKLIHLEELDLEDTHMHSQDVQVTAKNILSCKELKLLNLSGLKIKLQNSSSLTSIILKAITNLTNLLELNLTGTILSSNEANYLAKYLEKNVPLETLHVKDFSDEQSANTFSSALKNNTHLKKLFVEPQYNNLGFSIICSHILNRNSDPEILNALIKDKIEIEEQVILTEKNLQKLEHTLSMDSAENTFQNFITLLDNMTLFTDRYSYSLGSTKEKVIHNINKLLTITLNTNEPLNERIKLVQNYGALYAEFFQSVRAVFNSIEIEPSKLEDLYTNFIDSLLKNGTPVALMTALNFALICARLICASKRIIVADTLAKKAFEMNMIMLLKNKEYESLLNLAKNNITHKNFVLTPQFIDELNVLSTSSQDINTMLKGIEFLDKFRILLIERSSLDARPVCDKLKNLYSSTIRECLNYNNNDEDLIYPKLALKLFNDAGVFLSYEIVLKFDVVINYLNRTCNLLAANKFNIKKHTSPLEIIKIAEFIPPKILERTYSEWVKFLLTFKSIKQIEQAREVAVTAKEQGFSNANELFSKYTDAVVEYYLNETTKSNVVDVKLNFFNAALQKLENSERENQQVAPAHLYQQCYALLINFINDNINDLYIIPIVTVIKLDCIEKNSPLYAKVTRIQFTAYKKLFEGIVASNDLWLKKSYISFKSQTLISKDEIEEAKDPSQLIKLIQKVIKENTYAISKMRGKETSVIKTLNQLLKHVQNLSEVSTENFNTPEKTDIKIQEDIIESKPVEDKPVEAKITTISNQEKWDGWVDSLTKANLKGGAEDVLIGNEKKIFQKILDPITECIMTEPMQVITDTKNEKNREEILMSTYDKSTPLLTINGVVVDHFTKLPVIQRIKNFNVNTDIMDFMAGAEKKFYDKMKELLPRVTVQPSAPSLEETIVEPALYEQILEEHHDEATLPKFNYVPEKPSAPPLELIEAELIVVESETKTILAEQVIEKESKKEVEEKRESGKEVLEDKEVSALIRQTQWNFLSEPNNLISLEQEEQQQTKKTRSTPLPA